MISNHLPRRVQSATSRLSVSSQSRSLMALSEFRYALPTSIPPFSKLPLRSVPRSAGLNWRLARRRLVPLWMPCSIPLLSVSNVSARLQMSFAALLSKWLRRPVSNASLPCSSPYGSRNDRPTNAVTGSSRYCSAVRSAVLISTSTGMPACRRRLPAFCSSSGATSTCTV